MERFGFEKEKEITERDVINGLIKDPSNYDPYSKWKRQEELKANKENTSIANLHLEVRAVMIVLEVLKVSFGDKTLVQNALDALYDTVIVAKNEGEHELEKRLWGLYNTLLADYDKKFPDEN